MIFKKNKDIYGLLNDKKCRMGDMFLKYGAYLIMNGGWFDCNRCGSIINKEKAKDSDVGKICLNCFEIEKLKKYE